MQRLEDVEAGGTPRGENRREDPGDDREQHEDRDLASGERKGEPFVSKRSRDRVAEDDADGDADGCAQRDVITLS